VPRVRYDATEGGLRVPMIARWPGRIPAGSVCGEIATHMDLFATIACLAGAALPTDRKIDGRDISPLLLGEPGARSPHAVFPYYMGGQLQAVRAGRWKLHLALAQPLVQLGMGELGRSVTGRSSRMFGEPVPARLFDLAADPGETREGSAAHPEVVARMLALADETRRDIGDLGQAGAEERPAGFVANPRPQVLSPR
jgi:arylsulfatase A